MDEIVNYRDLTTEEKDMVLDELTKTSFGPVCHLQSIKEEMKTSKEGTLPQFVFVRRDRKVIGYLFLIAENEKSSKAFPWWAVDNSDELPLETDLRLLQYGIALCRAAGCEELLKRLKSQMEYHSKGIGRRSQEII